MSLHNIGSFALNSWNSQRERHLRTRRQRLIQGNLLISYDESRRIDPRYVRHTDA